MKPGHSTLEEQTITLSRNVEERLPSHAASYRKEPKPDSYLDGQEIPGILRKPKVHCHFHMSQTTDNNGVYSIVLVN